MLTTLLARLFEAEIEFSLVDDSASAVCGRRTFRDAVKIQSAANQLNIIFIATNATKTLAHYQKTN